MSDNPGNKSQGDQGKAASNSPTMDNAFDRVKNYITESIQRFVAFLFILISIGALIGYTVAMRREAEIILLTPALAGLLAYYNRTFAVIAFIFFMVLILIL